MELGSCRTGPNNKASRPEEHNTVVVRPRGEGINYAHSGPLFVSAQLATRSPFSGNGSEETLFGGVVIMGEEGDLVASQHNNHSSAAGRNVAIYRQATFRWPRPPPCRMRINYACSTPL